jgi:DNA-binding Lrp family transcriptional regulator
MMNLTDQDAQAVMAMQRGIPLTARPFRDVGLACGLSEEAVLAVLRRLLESGEARRLGGIFDARRIGFCSSLCCMDVPAGQMDAIAAKVAAVPGVTHAYERGWPAELPKVSPGGPGSRRWPNLWFTLAAPVSAFGHELESLRSACAPVPIVTLPATRRFKIDVVFDVRTRERDERVEPRPALALLARDEEPPVVLAERDKAVVKVFQGALEPEAEFFAKPAKRLGMDAAVLLAQMQAWQAEGVLRRIGLLLRHREIGFRANGMCCWKVASGGILAAGRRLADFPEVTHCYERPLNAAFPYNVYAMIHCKSWGEAQKLFVRISDGAGLSGGQLLLSVREFKKTSLKLF